MKPKGLTLPVGFIVTTGALHIELVAGGHVGEKDEVGTVTTSPLPAKGEQTEAVSLPWAEGCHGLDWDVAFQEDCARKSSALYL